MLLGAMPIIMPSVACGAIFAFVISPAEIVAVAVMLILLAVIKILRWGSERLLAKSAKS